MDEKIQLWRIPEYVMKHEGILIPIWTGECNAGEKDCLDQPFEELSKAARGFDLGKIKGYCTRRQSRAK